MGRQRLVGPCARPRPERARLRDRCWAGRPVSSLATRVGVVAAISAVVAGGTGVATAASRPPPGTLTTSLPLATSARTLGGTWATLPMGHLDQPLNTFWQLMFEPAGSSSWSDRVEATGVATNGGIVLAANAKSLVVGVRPSSRLTYSPLIATTNSGRSWSTGLVQNGLAQVPSSLAISPSGAALALAPGRRGGREVLISHAGKAHLVSWEVLLGSRTFASTAPAERCAPSSFTAVGYAGAAPVVGAACGRAGTAGLFTELGGHWTPEGPGIPRSAGSAEVLDLVPTGKGLATVIELHQRGSATESLLAAWSSDATYWRASTYLRLPAGERLTSLGPAGGQGVFVLMTGTGDKERLAVVNGPGSRSWHYLPAPPAETQTVTFGSTGPAQAFALNQSAIEVWDLGRGGGAGKTRGAGWRQGQLVHVTIQFGPLG